MDFRTVLLPLLLAGGVSAALAQIPVIGVGPDPELPAPEERFIPTLNIADAKPWDRSQQPTAAAVRANLPDYAPRA